MSTLYFWPAVEVVADNYHSGGGVVIVTNRDPLDVWDEYVGSITWGKGGYSTDEEARQALRTEAPQEFPLASEHPESLTIMTDAGCC